MSFGQLGAGFGRLGLGATGSGGGGVPGYVPSGAMGYWNFATAQYWPWVPTTEFADTRASDQYVTTAAGVLVKKAATVLAYSDTGLLVEPAATNYLLRSQALATAPWVAYGTTVLANNAAAAPDGTLTATSLADTATTDFFAAVQDYTSVSGANAWSIYLKAGSQSWATIQINESSNAAAAYFNLAGAGAVGSITALAGVSTISASAIAALGNGWYLCVIAGSPIGSAASTFAISSASSDGGRVYAGSGAVALYAWGAQGTVSAANSSYVLTGAAAATRAANAITVQRTGIGRVVYTFDDDSTQEVSGIDTGTQYPIPTSLNRRLIKSLTEYAAVSAFLLTDSIGAQLYDSLGQFLEYSI